jgi:ribonuclease HII
MPARIDPGLIPLAPDLEYESALWRSGIHLVAGLDEAGRGAWAGPVAAAVVLLPAAQEMLQVLSGVRDSKELIPAKREELAQKIKLNAAAWAVGMSSAAEIDQMGIVPATRLAMQRAISQLSGVPEHLLIDALFLPEVNIPQTALIKGDQRSLSIAAASILAKTSRDAVMRENELLYPGYGFAAHKGYGTAFHQKSLQRFGPCDIHRFSFMPVKEQLDKK